MTTPSSRFREIILDVLEGEFPESVSLELLYSAVEQQVAFDSDDLRPPTLHGGKVKEPSWKRNVRNVLQHMKQAGTLVNARRDRWRLPSPDPTTALDVSTSWGLVRTAAEESLVVGSEFHSPEQGHGYRIASVHEARVEILRLDASRPESLTRGEVERAIHYLNAAGGSCGRRTLNYTVAKESAIVALHPGLRWDAETDSIMSTNGTGAKPVYRDFGQAPDDDPEALSRFARRVRAGQPIFRRNLLTLYEGCCAISGCGPELVLEAAHIDPHAARGINHTENGLLLRSDLHTLFDTGLLRVDPSSLRIVLCPCLKTTSYWTYDGVRLRSRCDGSEPARRYLQGRWDAAARLHEHGGSAARTGGQGQSVGALNGASRKQS